MLSRISVKSDEPRRPPLGPKLLPRCHRHDNSCSLGVIDNITTGGSDSLNLYHSTRGRPDSFDTVRSRHFSPIGAVLRLSAVPATAGASGKGIWCSGWLKHDQLSTFVLASKLTQFSEPSLSLTSSEIGMAAGAAFAHARSSGRRSGPSDHFAPNVMQMCHIHATSRSFSAKGPQ